MIDPEFWSDEKTGKLDFAVQLLFIGMWNFADDEGLIKYSPEYLRSSVFPYKDIPVENMEIWQKKLEEENFLMPYGYANQRYAWIINFRNHQVINRPQPGKLPAPSIQNSNYCNALMLRDKGICHLCCKPITPFGPNDISGAHTASIDHLVPLSRGGTNYPSNLKIAGISCNKGRGNKGLEEFSEYSGNSIAKSATIPSLSSRYIHYIDLYNTKMNTSIHITDSRREHLKARMQEKLFVEHFEEVLDKIKSSPFLSGKRSSKDHPNWKADFDWIIKNQDNYTKILENKYHSDRDAFREKLGI